MPATGTGRLVAVGLMIAGVGSIAFLTAVAASAIVVGDMGEEERLIEREETAILSEVRAVADRLDRLEQLLRRPGPAAPRTPSSLLASVREDQQWHAFGRVTGRSESGLPVGLSQVAASEAEDADGDHA